MSIGYFLGIIALMFIIELPDKTFVATIVMASKARALPVLVGASSALVIHMGIAVEAGRLLTLFPVTVKNLVIAAFFLGGGAYLLLVKEKDEIEEGEREGAIETAGSWWKEFATAFAVIFIGEFGDLTQIQAANLSAKTHEPMLVFLASSIALILISFVGVFGGKILVKRIPLQKIRYAGGVIFTVLGIYTVIKLITG